MDAYNRIIVIVCIIVLAGFLGWLQMDAQNIAMIIQAIATPAGIYIAVKRPRNV